MLKQVILAGIGLVPFHYYASETLDIEMNEPRAIVGVQTSSSDKNTRYNNSVLNVDMLMPLSADKKHLTFVNVQTSYYNNLHWLYSAGIGHRNVDNNIVYGIYGFYDKLRSVNANDYDRFNLGIELLAQEWSVRTNFYFLPNTGEKKIGGSTTSTAVITQYEQAYSGAEIELGHNLGLEGLTGSVSHYNYGNVIKGNKLKLGYLVNNYISLTTSVQHDNVQGTVVKAGLSLFMGSVPSRKNSIFDRLRAPVVREMTLPVFEYETLVPKSKPSVDVISALNESMEAPEDDAPPPLVTEEPADDSIPLDLLAEG